MLNFGESSHERLFKQRRFILAIRVHINNWLLMLDFDKKEQFPVIILAVDYILHFKQTIYKSVQYYQVFHLTGTCTVDYFSGAAVNHGHTHGSFSMHKHNAQLMYLCSVIIILTAPAAVICLTSCNIVLTCVRELKLLLHRQTC